MSKKDKTRSQLKHAHHLLAGRGERDPRSMSRLHLHRLSGPASRQLRGRLKKQSSRSSRQNVRDWLRRLG